MPDNSHLVSRLLTVYAIPHIGTVSAHNDLADRICFALDRDGIGVKDGDVLVVASKIVSKAEGSSARVADRAGFEDLVASRTVSRVAARSFGTPGAGGAVKETAIVRTPHDTVQAAAGIDASNAGDEVVLHPQDPDASAAALKHAFDHYFGVQVGVIVSDTTSRPWRRGVSDFALGSAGVQGLDDRRGEPDDAGRRQGVTVRAVADEIAAAADLVKGSARGLPVAIVRGMAAHVLPEAPGARELTRPAEEDWFRHGHVEAVWESLGASRNGPQETWPLPPAEGTQDLASRVERAVAVARAGSSRTLGTANWHFSVFNSGSKVVISAGKHFLSASAQGHPAVEAALGLGALLDRFRSALWAEDLEAEIEYRFSENQMPSGAHVLITLPR